MTKLFSLRCSFSSECSLEPKSVEGKEFQLERALVKSGVFHSSKSFSVADRSGYRCRDQDQAIEHHLSALPASSPSRARFRASRRKRGLSISSSRSILLTSPADCELSTAWNCPVFRSATTPRDSCCTAFRDCAVRSRISWSDQFFEGIDRPSQEGCRKCATCTQRPDYRP